MPRKGTKSVNRAKPHRQQRRRNPAAKRTRSANSRAARVQVKYRGPKISRATGRSTAHWILQAVDDLVVKMVEFGVVASSAPLRGQRRKPWEREIKEELLARKELGEKLGRRDIRFYCD